MSTNIEVQRVCEHCQQIFTARTTVTRYCGHKCNRAAYKAALRAKKIASSGQETALRKAGKPVADLSSREFLTVPQVAVLLGCCRHNVYKMIRSGRMEAVNIMERKTLVRRAEVDRLTTLAKDRQAATLKKVEKVALPTSQVFALADCYKLAEVQQKFNISTAALQQLLKRNEIPKHRLGWYTYVPKAHIDALLA